MKVEELNLPGVLLIEPVVHRDERGFFLESWQQEKYRAAGITVPFVQDNHSRSALHTLRGLHAQLDNPQAKLVRCTEGEIFDVVVDIRRGSPNFGKWVSAVLSAENFKQLFVPAGYAHGFCVLSPRAQLEYKTSRLYDPHSEITVLWNDPALDIPWPIEQPVLSTKDANAKTLSQLADRLPLFKV